MIRVELGHRKLVFAMLADITVTVKRGFSQGINEVMEQMFRGIMAGQRLPVRQIRIAMYNLERLDTHPKLWGRTP